MFENINKDTLENFVEMIKDFDKSMMKVIRIIEDNYEHLLYYNSVSDYINYDQYIIDKECDLDGVSFVGIDWESGVKVYFFVPFEVMNSEEDILAWAKKEEDRRTQKELEEMRLEQERQQKEEEEKEQAEFLRLYEKYGDIKNETTSN